MKQEDVKINGGWSRRSSPHAVREVGRDSINTARRVGPVLREWLLKPCEKQGVGRGEHRCIERQMQNARNLIATASNAAVLWDSAVQGVNLGSLHRIHVDAARAAFKLSRERTPVQILTPRSDSTAMWIMALGEGVNEAYTDMATTQLSKEQRDGWSSRSSDELLPMTHLRP